MIRKLPIAWLQLTRNKTRLLVALAGIAFADLLMFMQLGFQFALYDSATEIHRHLSGDLVLIHPRAETLIDVGNRLSFPQRRLYQALGFEGVESVAALYIRFADWINPQALRSRAILAFGCDPHKKVFNLPEVNRNLNRIEQPDVVLFDRTSKADYGPVVIEFERGKNFSTEVNGRKIKVGGLFTLGGSIFSADGILITSDLNFVRLFHKTFNKDLEEISVGLINLESNADAQKVMANLVNYFPNDVKVLTRQQFIELEKNYWASNSAIGYIFALGTVMGFLVGTIIVYQILYTDVSDHLAEYATLKAIGFTDIYLLGVVFQEALILAILGYIPGFAISLGLYDLTKNVSRLPMNMDLNCALLILLLTVMMCFISGAIAVRKLQYANPADIF